MSREEIRKMVKQVEGGEYVETDKLKEMIKKAHEKDRLALEKYDEALVLLEERYNSTQSEVDFEMLMELKKMKEDLETKIKIGELIVEAAELLE